MLLTRITDWIVLKYMNVEFVEELLYDPRSLTKFYNIAGTIKIIALLAIMVLSTYAKVHRESLYASELMPSKISSDPLRMGYRPMEE